MVTTLVVPAGTMITGATTGVGNTPPAGVTVAFVAEIATDTAGPGRSTPSMKRMRMSTSIVFGCPGASTGGGTASILTSTQYSS